MFPSFEEEMRARGSQTAHKLLDMRIVPAEGKVTENLALPEGILIVLLQRQRLVDGDVAGYEIRYLWYGDPDGPVQSSSPSFAATGTRWLSSAAPSHSLPRRGSDEELGNWAIRQSGNPVVPSCQLTHCPIAGLRRTRDDH